MESFEDEVNEFLGGLVVSSPEQVEDEQERQRTAEWHEKRRGKTTGSKFKNLMATKSRETKANQKSWGSKFWLLDFGDGALTYIKELAYERGSGNCIIIPDIFAFRWGRENEPLAKAACEQMLGVEIKEVEFLEFQKNAGASPDGSFVLDGKTFGAEFKCPSTVASHYNLGIEPVVEGHDYFWQVTGEMLALETDSLLFATFHKDYPEAARFKHQWVKLSEVHAFALRFRCYIANLLIDQIIESNYSLDIRAAIDLIGEDVPEGINDISDWLNERLEV